jgi:hypothetical protein
VTQQLEQKGLVLLASLVLLALLVVIVLVCMQPYCAQCIVCTHSFVTEDWQVMLVNARQILE